MNIKRELNRAQFRKNVTDRFKRAIFIVKQFMCQHKECASEVITVSLGNTADSVLSEILGESEAQHNHTMKLRRIYCLSCGRELFREIISFEENPSESPSENQK